MSFIINYKSVDLKAECFCLTACNYSPKSLNELV